MQVKPGNLKRTQACIKKENVDSLHDFTSRGLKTKEPREGPCACHELITTVSGRKSSQLWLLLTF